MSTATHMDLTHTEALLQVPEGGLASAPRQNIESGIPGVRLNPTLMRHEIFDAELAEEVLRTGFTGVVLTLDQDVARQVVRLF